jgi:hypothetical protein
MELSFDLEVKFEKFKAINYFVENCRNSKDSQQVGMPEHIDTLAIFDAIDSVFDLGDSNFFKWMKLSEEEQSKFWEIVSKLIKAGILGYRYYEVNGHLERHFIEYEMANPMFANAKVKYIDKKQYSREWLV